MKTKYPSMFGILAMLMLVASLVIPANLASPAKVEADPGICKWDTIREPGALPGSGAITPATENLDIAIGSDGATIVVVQMTAAVTGTTFQYSTTGGISWSGTRWNALTREPQWLTGTQTYAVAMAPDNPKIYAVTTDNPVLGWLGWGPREVWITTDGGSTWEITNLFNELNWPLIETIRTIDISVDYGGRRDISVGTTTGFGGGSIYVLKSTGFTGWIDQNDGLSTLPMPMGQADYFAVKFSPTYAGDSSLAMVYATTPASGFDATFFNIALRDIDQNITPVGSYAFTYPGIEVKDPNSAVNASPSLFALYKADLELPSDFSGQAASLRRAYVSLDCPGFKAVGATETGIYRIDDTTVYELMDTTTIAGKDIYSIAYFGTYASGKLLAGERFGFPCAATVPTWFTDSPTTCPIPCWYPALKPTTGAAAQGTCAVNAKDGVGAAITGWNANATLGIVITSSNAVTFGTFWYGPLLAAPTALDESAFAISRNNGETWNQLSLIDTLIVRFTDVAPTPDCTTVYLASVNDLVATGCNSFDSIWRSSKNNAVTSPLPAMPIGTYWERVYTHVSALNCTEVQTNRVLLRLVPYCADPSGQIVAVAAQGTRAQAWSPDFGDYWAMITPRDTIQDFCFESATILYNLSPGGLVQKLPYTGTAWSTAQPSVDTYISVAHTIAAYPEGKVLVGAGWGYHMAAYAVSYCANFNTDSPLFAMQAFAGQTPYMGNVHVAFDPNFKDNNTYFICDGSNPVTALGSVYRGTPGMMTRWQDVDMMDVANGAIGCNAPDQVWQFGLVISFTGEALYSAHTIDLVDANSGVCRTIEPFNGMPKPGIAWDCLNTFVPATTAGVLFTLEPTSLKACGCCTLDTDTQLYAIDNRFYVPNFAAGLGQGLIWAFTDCMAKKGPALITADKSLIGCDPVSGRAQEVNLCWEQLCVADRYDIEIAKNAQFTIVVIDWTAEAGCGGLMPVDVTAPCVFIPAGGIAAPYEGSAIAMSGNLECGHTYYWRVKVRSCATLQWIRSPWSEVRSFTIKAGLPVTTPYYGVQLLSPNNGGLGIPVKPVSFSWSPFLETTKYKFVLAKDAAMTQVVKEADVTTTAFQYDGTLDYSTSYFWRVMSVEPAPSDWSATFSIMTEAAPPAAPGPTPAPPTPVWVWVVIAIGAILVIVTLVLIFKTRRV